MANIFKGSAAPYVLVLLLSLVGWMFNSALESAKNLRILEYRFEYGKDGDVDTITFYIANRSMTGAINAGKFNFKCPRITATIGSPAEATCLVKMPSVHAEAQYIGSANFGLPVSPIPSADGISANAQIPPRSEVGYKIGVKDNNIALLFGYVLSDEDIKGDKSNIQVRIRQAGSSSGSDLAEILDDWTLFVISNYITVLLSALFLLGVLILLYLVISFFYLFIRKDAPTSKDTFHVTINGEKHVATVEKC